MNAFPSARFGLFVLFLPSAAAKLGLPRILRGAGQGVREAGWERVRGPHPSDPRGQVLVKLRLWNRLNGSGR